MARRVLRTMVYGFIIVVMAGVVWHAYRDDQTKDLISAWGYSSLAWLSSALGTKTGSNLAVESGAKSADQAVT
jgi:hypothetical protein